MIIPTVAVLRPFIQPDRYTPGPVGTGTVAWDIARGGEVRVAWPGLRVEVTRLGATTIYEQLTTAEAVNILAGLGVPGYCY